MDKVILSFIQTLISKITYIEYVLSDEIYTGFLY